MNKSILEERQERFALLTPPAKGQIDARVIPTRSIERNLRATMPREGSVPTVQGRFLNVDARRFWIKAVTYGTFRPNSAGEPFPERAQVQQP